MEKKKKDDLLAVMLKRFKMAADADASERKDSIEDQKFVLGGENQWDPEAKAARVGRPMLTVNKLPKFIRQVTGDQRQNRPSIKVRPVDSQADPEIAKILEGHIRNIEYNSNAAMAYDIAFKQAVSGGYPGFWRIATEYSDDDTFDQDIVILPVHNQYTVYCDPATILDVYNGKLDWGFITETMDEATFKARWPNKLSQEWEQGTGEEREGWFLDNQVRVAEYFYREPRTKKLYQLESGEVVDGDKVKMFIQGEGRDKILVSPDGTQAIRITRERSVDCHEIKWVKVTGNEILEGPSDWAGKYIPIIPVFGDTWVIEGQTFFKSLIRDAKDPAKVYNYCVSQNMEMTALAPKVPYKATPKQIKGHESQWNVANVSPRPYLLYNPDPQAPPPTREQGVQPQTAWVQMALQATDDMKDTTGIYDASLGQRSNEQSGRAILARQREGDIGTFEFIDNLTRAIQFTGKVLVDLIPKIYDTERTLRVLGQDDMPQHVQINKEIQGPNGERVLVNDVTVGKYDTHVSSGPSFTTMRAENADALQSMIQAAPNLSQILIPRWAKMMDWPDAQEVADEIAQFMQPQENPNTQIELEKLRAEIEKLRADSILSLAKAEATESGTQLEQYKMFLDTVMTRMEAMQQPQPMPQPAPQPMPEMPMEIPPEMMQQEPPEYTDIEPTGY